MSSHIEQFLAARRAGSPLILIQSPDPAITIEEITTAVAKKGAAKQVPIIKWDCIRGYLPVTTEGKKAIAAVCGTGNEEEIKSKSNNPTEAAEMAGKFPGATNTTDGSIFFMMNAHVGFDPPNPNFIQAIWNLRDLYKQDGRQIILLSPGCNLPQELSQDILTIDEPLPDPQQLEKIVKSCFAATSGSPQPPEGLMPKAVDALCGLASFPAEQVTSMSLFRDENKTVTLNLNQLWSRKRQIIEQTPGMSVWAGGERFDDIGGLANAKNFYNKILNGKKPPRAIVWLDEIEKALSGATSGTGDTSGVSQGFLGQILSEMQNCKYTGTIAVGPGGGGKSLFAKAIGNEAGIPTVELDLGAMKGSLVGESERSLRNALKVIKAISGSNALWFATSNKASILPPELRRRFTFGLMFFDLPTPEERDVIWNLYMKRFELTGERPDDDLWTGAEIQTCCDLAWRMECSLVEASEYISPLAKSAPEQLAELRGQAHCRYISASYPGVYKNDGNKAVEAGSRLIKLDEDDD